MEFIQTIFTLYLCLKRINPKTIYKDLRDIIMREYLRNHPELPSFEKEYFRENPHLVKRYTWLVKQGIFINSYIGTASENGHAELVRLLLADPRVDPAAEDNEAILFASKYGHTEVVQLLLTYRNLYHPEREVNPAAFDDYAIREASEYGHAEVVRLLLNYRNLDHPEREVNPAALDNQAISNASLYGRVEVVRLLLADPRVDPSTCDIEAILFASKKGHTEVVRLLLTDPRVRDSVNMDKPPRDVYESGKKFSLEKRN